jgi:hypothetical protein
MSFRGIVLSGVSVAAHACGNDGVSSPARSLSAPGRSELRHFRLQGRAIGGLNLVTRNIRVAESALKRRIGFAPAGFRTPGGFNDGLAERPDLQSMLQKMGYKWVSWGGKGRYDTERSCPDSGIWVANGPVAGHGAPACRQGTHSGGCARAQSRQGYL